ncbi:hypothetical protein BHE74_00026489 [Ensete ventricosum]|nr:hypothetical protein BHE74_00026489 [Ensete ventricosum]
MADLTREGANLSRVGVASEQGQKPKALHHRASCSRITSYRLLRHDESSSNLLVLEVGPDIAGPLNTQQPWGRRPFYDAIDFGDSPSTLVSASLIRRWEPTFSYPEMILALIQRPRATPCIYHDALDTDLTATDKVLDLVLYIVALLSVRTVVVMEAAVALAVAFLGSSPYWVGGFEESFLPDLEEDRSPSEVEWSVRKPGNGLLGSFLWLWQGRLVRDVGMLLAFLTPLNIGHCVCPCGRLIIPEAEDLESQGASHSVFATYLSMDLDEHHVGFGL